MMSDSYSEKISVALIDADADLLNDFNAAPANSIGSLLDD